MKRVSHLPRHVQVALYLTHFIGPRILLNLHIPKYMSPPIHLHNHSFDPLLRHPTSRLLKSQIPLLPPKTLISHRPFNTPPNLVLPHQSLGIRIRNPTKHNRPILAPDASFSYFLFLGDTKNGLEIYQGLYC